MFGYMKTNCKSREHCKKKDSFVCANCVRNQSRRFDNYEYESKPFKINITSEENQHG